MSLQPFQPPETAIVPLPLQLIAETAAMTRFYSRLPLRSFGSFDDPAMPPPFTRACRMLPLASIVIGLPAACLAALLGSTALPAIVVATLAIAVGAIVTGALHEDGLADTIDGFGGGATILRKLEIMKDSRIGAYGVLALVLSVIVRVGLVAGLLSASPWTAASGMIAASVVSRVCSLWLFAALPPARTDGAAVSVGRPSFDALLVAILIGLALVLLAGAPWFGVLRLVIGITAAALVTIGLARLAFGQIGGQTGDIIGAAQQLAEIGFLLGLMVL